MASIKQSALIRFATFGAFSCLLAACAGTQQAASRTPAGDSLSGVSAYSSEEASLETPTSAMNWMPGKAERNESRKTDDAAAVELAGL